MLGLPSTDWTEAGPDPAAITDAAPATLAWRDAGAVEHVFTHFSLTLRVLSAEGGAPGLEWLPETSAGDLPSVFLKAVRRAQGMSGEE
jgi:A/G-specific adenine glycosylase